MPAYRYIADEIGRPGEHYEMMIPARDLSADEFDALTDDQKTLVVSTEPYALYEAVEGTGEPWEPPTDDEDETSVDADTNETAEDETDANALAIPVSALDGDESITLPLPSAEDDDGHHEAAFYDAESNEGDDAGR